MPPRGREFALLCALLVALHAAAAGSLWLAAGADAARSPATADTSADAETLLLAAAHNDAALSMTSDVTYRHPDNGSTVARTTIAAAPADGRVRARVIRSDGRVPLVADEVYVTPWGRWERTGRDWQYTGTDVASYDDADARLFVPIPDSAAAVRTNTHDNGTVTIRLEGARSELGVLAFAGDDATLSYRIAFDGDRPYVVHATARPVTGEAAAVTVDRRYGATVRRPAALAPTTPREARDRLLAGASVG